MADNSSKNYDDERDAAGSGRAEDLRRVADTARTRATEAINEVKVAGNQLVDRVRDLIEEGNVRRIVIKRGDKTLLEIPLTVGVGAGAAAVLFSPILAAVGALAALVSEITLVVEREGDDAEGMGGEPAPNIQAGSLSSGTSGSTGSSGSTGGSVSGADAGGPEKTVGRGTAASEGGDAGI